MADGVMYSAKLHCSWLWLCIWLSLSIHTVICNYTADPQYPWAVPGSNADTRFNFRCKHTRNVNIMNRTRAAGVPIDIVLYGDSVFETMRTDGQDCPMPPAPDAPTSPRPNPVQGVPDVYAKYFTKGNTINLSIVGDRVGGLMWRVLNGEAPYGMAAKVAVIMIGTNDLFTTAGDDLDEDNADAVAYKVGSIAQLLTSRHPALQVLVMGILPRSNGWWVDSAWPSRFTPKIEKVNAALRYWVPLQARMQYVDCGALFINASGSGLNETMMQDGLHPSGQGWDRMAVECVIPALKSLGVTSL